MTLMNLAMVSSPNFGSGSIVRLGTSRRLGIYIQFHYQRTVATAGQTVQFLSRRTGFLPIHVATVLIAHRTGAADSSHQRLLPPERNHTVRQLFVANSLTLPSRLLWRPLFILARSPLSPWPVSYAGLFTVCLLPAALGQPVQNLCIYLRYDFGRFAPYLDRPCRRSPTPDVSSVPRTV